MAHRPRGGQHCSECGRKHFTVPPEGASDVWGGTVSPAHYSMFIIPGPSPSKDTVTSWHLCCPWDKHKRPANVQTAPGGRCLFPTFCFEDIELPPSRLSGKDHDQPRALFYLDIFMFMKIKFC